MIGFKPSRKRTPIRNDQGDKVGYLASVGGRQVFQDVSGKTVATILRFKLNYVPSRVGACTGSWAPMHEGWR